MKLEQSTWEALVKAAFLIGAECNFYECETEEQEALMEIIEKIEVLLDL